MINSGIYGARIDVFPTIFKSSLSIRLQGLEVQRTFVDVKIFNSTGRLIRSFENLDHQHLEIYWNGRDESGVICPAGNYFIIVFADDEIVQTKKVTKKVIKIR